MNTFFQPDSTDDALFQLACAIRETGYHFTTVTPATHEVINRRPENRWASNLTGVFGWSRPFRAEILPSSLWDMMRRADVILPHEDGWRSSVRLSSLNGQLFLHSAYPTSSADAVFFGPDTYRFAAAITNMFASQSLQINRAVDIGCGAGPGAILTALSHAQAQVFAVDINDAALRFTRINTALAATSNVIPAHSNLLSNVEGQFDLIVANPPYLIDPSERSYRHGGGPLGAGLSLAIVDAALQRLASGGTLLLYTGSAIVDGADLFKVAVDERLRQENITWLYHEVDPDIFGEELLRGAYTQTDRIAAVVLTVTKS